MRVTPAIKALAEHSNSEKKTAYNGVFVFAVTPFLFRGWVYVFGRCCEFLASFLLTLALFGCSARPTEYREYLAQPPN